MIPLKNHYWLLEEPYTAVISIHHMRSMCSKERWKGQREGALVPVELQSSHSSQSTHLSQEYDSECYNFDHTMNRRKKRRVTVVRAGQVLGQVAAGSEAHFPNCYNTALTSWPHTPRCTHSFSKLLWVTYWDTPMTSFTPSGNPTPLVNYHPWPGGFPRLTHPSARFYTVVDFFIFIFQRQMHLNRTGSEDCFAFQSNFTWFLGASMT